MLLETEKGELFHYLNVIAESENCVRFHMCTAYGPELNEVSEESLTP